jgi:microsomal dipeptidase-like Zn-dependent dipeptidase
VLPARAARRSAWALAGYAAIISAKPRSPPELPYRDVAPVFADATTHTARDAPVLGYADLHTHLAMHLAFGAGDGDPGPFWGSPGMAWDPDDSTLADDLPPCSPGSHTGWWHPMARFARSQVVAFIDSTTGAPHFEGGYPDFDGWPNAQSLLHQQMHVSWLHRAYRGGLRLLVTSAADTEFIADAWNWSPLAKPKHDPAFDLRSARAQLAFLERFAAANRSWMTIVRSAAEARDAVASGKLALVLGLEMDTLSAADVETLACEFPIRQVTPIHLADNAFGGSAVYHDAFNANMMFLTGRYYRVAGDRTIAFRLTAPRDATREAYCALGYECCPGDAGATGAECLADVGAGHKNALGLSDGGAGILRLMRDGFLLDVAHMSEKSAEDTLSLGERYGYPVMDSHTDLRPDSGQSSSERELPTRDARRIAHLGGILGLGTGPHAQPRAVLDAFGSPLVRLSAAAPAWSVRVAPALPTVDPSADASALEVSVQTGATGLRGGPHDYAALRVRLKEGHARDVEGTLNVDADPRTGGLAWAPGSTHTAVLSLPPSTLVADIASISLLLWPPGGADDRWDIDRARVKLPAGQPLADLLAGAHLTPSVRELVLYRATPSIDPDARVQHLSMTITTGNDDLRAEDTAIAFVRIKGRSREYDTVLNAAPGATGESWAAGSTHVVLLAPLDGEVPISDVEEVGLRTVQHPSTFQSPDVWEVNEVRVEALADPVRAWLEDYRAALDAMGGQGVALGTDLNGLARQIPFGPEDASDLPIDLAVRMGVPQSEALGESRAGRRRFRFAKDGIAHVGLVPDFLQAVERSGASRTEAAQLFHSAEAFIAMWEKVEAARNTVAEQAGCDMASAHAGVCLACPAP